MASIAFAAVAFAAAGYALKKLDGDDIGEEMARHNAATEMLAAAKEKWSEDEISHRDKMQKLKQELSDANANINDTNKALDALAATLRREPRLEDYYTPSPEMVRYQTITNGLLGAGAGWIGYKTYKYMSKRK